MAMVMMQIGGVRVNMTLFPVFVGMSVGLVGG